MEVTYPTRISLVVPYYDNPGMLQMQCEFLSKLPEDIRTHLEFVVVDDGSPRWPAESYKCGVSMQVWRIDVDVRWNQDAARNIGALHATHDWLFLTDIDHVPVPSIWDKLIKNKWDCNNVHRFERVSAPNMTPYHPHPNTFFLHRSLYDTIGGYDERLAGYYGSDGDFVRRLEARAAGSIRLDLPIVRFGREVQPDASTTTYKRKEWFDKPTIKGIIENRNRLPPKEQAPKRYLFPYHKVYPAIVEEV